MTNPNHRRKPIRITRAKLVDGSQFTDLLAGIKDSEHALRDEVLIRLSFNCGLRAQEVAGVQWKRHILDSKGQVGKVLRVTRDIAKGERNRIVERDLPMPEGLINALKALRTERPKDTFVIYALSAPRNFSDGRENRAEKGGCAPNTLVQYFRRLYEAHAFNGCTSHSGRRSFITYAARDVNNHDASLRDVQLLAGHARLETTAGYIEPSTNQKALVGALFT